MDPSPTAPTDEHPPSARAWRPAAPTDEAAVARLMAAIAAGDQPAIWALRTTADGPVRSRIRGELRRLNVRYEAEDLDAMVTDAVLAISDVAGAWRPGGAPPWAWAHHRVVGAVHRFVGTFADSIDALGDGDTDGGLGWLATHAMSAGSGTAGGTGPATGEVDAVDPHAAVATGRAALRALGTSRGLAALLDDALTQVATPRDAAVWLAMAEERSVENRHPAVTVAARFGMRPAAVRQVVHRVWGRLDDITTDGRFTELRDVPLFAGRRRGPQVAR